MARSSKCPVCGQNLTEIGFNTNYCILLCNNWHCPKYREPQGYRLKDKVKEPVKAFVNSSRRPGYQPYLATKRQNYRILRELGVPSTVAARNTSSRRRRELELEYG